MMAFKNFIEEPKADINQHVLNRTFFPLKAKVKSNCLWYSTGVKNDTVKNSKTCIYIYVYIYEQDPTIGVQTQTWIFIMLRCYNWMSTTFPIG